MTDQSAFAELKDKPKLGFRVHVEFAEEGDLVLDCEIAGPPPLFRLTQVKVVAYDVPDAEKALEWLQHVLTFGHEILGGAMECHAKGDLRAWRDPNVEWEEGELVEWDFLRLGQRSEQP